MSAPATSKTTASPTDDTSRAFLLTAIALVLSIELGAFYFLKDGSNDFAGFTIHGDREATQETSIFVSIPPVLANVADESELHPLSLSLEIKTSDADTANLLTEQMPSIQNAVVAMFSGQPLAYVTTLEGKQQIRQEALERIRAIIDTEGGDSTSVENIYFSSLIIN